MVELEGYIKECGVDYWIYGHSHYNVDMRIGETWCVSNQLGYVFHDEHLTLIRARPLSYKREACTFYTEQPILVKRTTALSYR